MRNMYDFSPEANFIDGEIEAVVDAQLLEFRSRRARAGSKILQSLRPYLPINISNKNEINSALPIIALQLIGDHADTQRSARFATCITGQMLLD